MSGRPTFVIRIAAIATVACSPVKPPVGTSSAPDTGPAARAIVEAALAAQGGKARLASLRSLRLHGVGTTTVQGQRIPVETTRVLVLPDKMRVDTTMSSDATRVTVSLWISGEAGWQRVIDPATKDDVVSELGQDSVQALRFERWRDPDLILLKAMDPAAKLTVLPDDTVVGGDLYSVVRLQSPFDADVFLYVHKQTRLLGRVIYSDGRHTDSDELSDYRNVGGLQFAYKRTARWRDKTTTLELTTLEINPEIDVTLFDRPAIRAPGATLAETPPPPDTGTIPAQPLSAELAPPPPPPPPPPPLKIMQKLLEANRIAGVRNIRPDDPIKMEIAKAGRTKVSAAIELCISKTGTVESVTVQRSTGYIDYDRKLQREMQQWRYRPVVLNGEPTGVCLPFRFIYNFTRDEVIVDG